LFSASDFHLFTPYNGNGRENLRAIYTILVPLGLGGWLCHKRERAAQGVSLNPLREIPGKWKQKLLVCGCMAERKRPKTGATKNKRPRLPVRNFDYPDQTKGSRLAAQLREETNALSEKQRNELFQRGMQIVYGGAATKQKSGPGH